MTEAACATPKIPVDFSHLKKTVGDNRALFLKLAEQALRDYPIMVEGIREALARGDGAGLGRLSHTLKGSVANFGAEEVRQLASRLELLGKGGDLSEAPAALAALESELETLYAFFAKPQWVEEI